MASTVGDVAELGDVDVEKLYRGNVFIAADWSPVTNACGFLAGL
jgi:hypothetical protein